MGPRRNSLVFVDLRRIIERHRIWVESNEQQGERAILRLAFLYQADLSRAQLSRANAVGAHLVEANLTAARLDQANLSQADLRDAILTGANLEGANLAGANLSGANLSLASLDGANLKDADLTDVTGLVPRQLKDVVISGATLGVEDLLGSLAGGDPEPEQDRSGEATAPEDSPPSVQDTAAAQSPHNEPAVEDAPPGQKIEAVRTATEGAGLELSRRGEQSPNAPVASIPSRPSLAGAPPAKQETDPPAEQEADPAAGQEIDRVEPEAVSPAGQLAQAAVPGTKAPTDPVPSRASAVPPKIDNEDAVASRAATTAGEASKPRIHNAEAEGARGVVEETQTPEAPASRVVPAPRKTEDVAAATASPKPVVSPPSASPKAVVAPRAPEVPSRDSNQAKKVEAATARAVHRDRGLAEIRTAEFKAAEESTRRIRVVFLSVILACVYSWLAVATTTDVGLVTNSATGSLPFIDVNIPIVIVFWALPVLLLGFQIDLLLDLARESRLLARVRVDSPVVKGAVVPWFIKGLLRSGTSSPRLGPWVLARLRSAASVFLVWWLVPLSLYLVWARYVPRHDVVGSAFHVILIGSALILGFISYRSVTAKLQASEPRPFVWTKCLTDSRLYTRGVVAVGVVAIALLSGAASTGWATVSESDGSAFQATLGLVGYRAYAVVEEQDVSTKLGGWTPGDVTQLQGAQLGGGNLRYARAASAFLVNSDLGGADLQGASLAHANLEGVDLTGASLDSAFLGGADLRNANLTGASLSGVRGWAALRRLENANFYRARNLPDGFLEWAFEHGAVCLADDTWSAVRAGRYEAPRPSGGDDLREYCDVTGDTPAMVVASIELTPSGDTLMVAGQTAQFAALATSASSDTIEDPTLRWQSSDPTIATVDAGGLVAAVNPGLVAISATSGGVSGVTDVLVSAALVGGGTRANAPDTITPIGAEPATTDTLAEPGQAVPLDTSATPALADTMADPALSLESSHSTIALVGAAQVATVDVTPSADSAAAPSDSMAASPEPGETTTAVGGGNSTAADAGASRPLLLTTVSAGIWQTCGVDASGGAFCWGRNARPDGRSAPTADEAIPAPVGGSLEFTMVSSGTAGAGGHTCGITTGGKAFCWGGDAGDRSTQSPAIPVPVPGGHTFAMISTGLRHVCGVTTSNQAYCWGSNFGGALGNGLETNAALPTPVADGSAFHRVSAGSFFTCALNTAGYAFCWGSNRRGQLGIGSTDQRSHVVPEPVRGGLRFRAISAGAAHVCGVTVGGAVHCWGANDRGQLGTGDTVSTNAPVVVAGGHNFRSIRASGHTCGVTTRGTVYCWGDNANGQLGRGAGGDVGDVSLTPVAVSPSVRFGSVSVGTDHTCAVDTRNAVYCWGSNEHAQLGRPVEGTCTGNACRKPPAVVLSGRR